jgi:hypothetical protein
MILKTYNKSNINLSRLDTEILNSNTILNYQGSSLYDNSLFISGDNILNENSLDIVINNHEPETLSELKTRRIMEIDTKTQQIISLGFNFDGKTFSLSAPAQTNWTNLKANADLLNSLNFFPIIISTINSEQYSLTYPNVTPFWMSGFGVISTTYKSGSDYKVAILQATTKEQVDLIIDER